MPLLVCVLGVTLTFGGTYFLLAAIADEVARRRARADVQVTQQQFEARARAALIAIRVERELGKVAAELADRLVRMDAARRGD